MTKTSVSVRCDDRRSRLPLQGRFPLRSQFRFSEIARVITDAWVNNAGKPVSADKVYGSVEKMLRINMVLAAVDMRPESPWDWRVEFIRSYGIPTTLLDARRLQQSRRFAEFPEKPYIERHVIDACKMAEKIGRPNFGKFDSKIHDIKVAAEWLLLPDTSGRGRWCIALLEIHSISSSGRPTQFDDVDLSILQLLREGLSAREIGIATQKSARTVEHRIEKMKARAGVNAIVQLLTTAS